MSGIEYPLHERAVAELKHSQTKLFKGTKYVLLSGKENQNLEEAPKSWVHNKGVELQTVLLSEG